MANPFLDFTPEAASGVRNVAPKREPRIADDRVLSVVNEVALELGIEPARLLEHTKVSGLYGGGSVRSEITRAKAEVSRRARARYFMSRVEVARALGLDHASLRAAERAFP